MDRRGDPQIARLLDRLEAFAEELEFHQTGITALSRELDRIGVDGAPQDATANWTSRRQRKGAA